MLKKLLNKWNHSHLNHYLQKSQHPAHCIYFAAVASEAHGIYGWVAVFLFIITLSETLEA